MFQYQKFELVFHGEEPAGSQSEIDLRAVFTCGGTEKEVSGFYAGNGTYIVRYLPQQTGLVQWRISGFLRRKDRRNVFPAKTESIMEW